MKSEETSKASPRNTLRTSRARWAVALGALAVLGGTTFAQQKADNAPTKVYVRARNTRLMKSSDLRAKQLKLLQPGDEVAYLGVDEANRQWRQVKVDGLVGVVFQSNLSLTPPKAENLGNSTTGAAELKSYASKGAAIKALGPGALAYASKSNAADVALKLAGAELLATEIGDKEMAKHAAEAGLFAVVGGGGGGSGGGSGSTSRRAP